MKIYILFLLTACSGLLATAQQQLPNASFENWKTDASLPYENPDNWFGTSANCNFTNTTTTCNPTTLKTTDVNAGMYAAKLVNVVSSFDGDIFPGQLLYSPSSDGYVNFTSKPKTLTGYYKFNNAGSDKVSIIVSLVGSSITDYIGAGSLDLTTSKTGYTLFSVPITYLQPTATPKDIYVIITFNDNASVNSNFTVDNLVFTYTSTPTSTATPVSAGIQFFPNPGKEEIHFEQSVKNISIQTANGSMILSHTADTDMLNINSLEKGIYIISYEYKGALIHGKLIVED